MKMFRAHYTMSLHGQWLVHACAMHALPFAAASEEAIAFRFSFLHLHSCDGLFTVTSKRVPPLPFNKKALGLISSELFACNRLRNLRCVLHPIVHSQCHPVVGRVSEMLA